MVAHGQSASNKFDWLILVWLPGVNCITRGVKFFFLEKRVGWRKCCAHVVFVRVKQICPFLQLALLLLKYPFNGNRTKGKLIPRDNFKKVLENLVRGKKCQCTLLFETDGFDTCQCGLNAEEKRRQLFIKDLLDDGLSMQDIGTHSWRKGSASFAACGTTAGPSIVSICIRAGWKISNVLKRYLSMENAGDWFLGRVVTGLPLYDKKFSVLPPRFKQDMSEDDRAFVDSTLAIVFPNPEKWGDHMVPIFRHLLATLAWHDEYLQSLPKTHFFRSSYLSITPQCMRKLHGLVELTYAGDDPTHRYFFMNRLRVFVFFIGWRKCGLVVGVAEKIMVAEYLTNT